MPERQQLRVLFRSFFSRTVDLELLSPGGDVQTLAIQFAALMAAFNFVVAYLMVPRYFTSPLPHAILAMNAWSDEEFLISATISVVGLFTVLAWDTLLPDQRDSFVLGVLPVRIRTIALAKMAAIACAVGGIVVLVNIFTGLCFAGIANTSGGVLDALRTLASYWITMFAAALFTVSALIGIQGLMAQVLSYRLFLRASGLVQLLAFFSILALFFVKPQVATVVQLSLPENRDWLRWLPSCWFLGLFQELNGTTQRVFEQLAQHALWATLAAVTGCAIMAVLAYSRTMRCTVEQPDIQPRDHSHRSSRLWSEIAEFMFHRTIDRAIVLFTLRTLTRSRQHRLLLALYGGIGLALALAYTESLLHGDGGQNWNRANAPLLVASLFVLFFSVFGTRIVFTFPQALRCNWIFRVTAVQKPAAYFAAARKSLYAVAALPVWILLTVIFLAIWPGQAALLHSLVIATLAIIITEMSLQGFRKIPFACSYLPGKANLKVTLGVYASIILFAAHEGGELEFWAMHRPARYTAFIGILIFWAVRARYRFREFAIAPLTPIQFEDRPAGELFAMDFRRDGELLGEENYVEPDLRRSLRRRLLLLGGPVLLLLLCGILYEQAGRWHDHRLAPRVGSAIDVGGRTLNLYCLGQGGPTVIFESNWGLPGYSWLHIQRDVAKFTRACWYDRAGYGWSDPGPFPNHSDSVARDLHRLLVRAHVPPPYVLVSHALGSFDARVFRGSYPDEVTGMVFVDPTSEDLTINIHNHIEFFRRTILFMHEVMGNVGIFRLMKSDPGSPPVGFTQQEWDTLSILQSQTKSLVAEGKEPPLWICGEQARSAGAFGNIPVVVLSAGIQDQEEDPKLDHDHALKLQLQRRLAALSSRGVQQIVSNSGHWMVFDAPKAVVGAIEQVIVETRDPRHMARYALPAAFTGFRPEAK